MLRACYDLSVSPASFDFVTFLLDIERERIARGEKEVSISYRRGPDGGFRRDSLWPPTVAERTGLLENVVKPMAALLPSLCPQEQPPSALDYGFGAPRFRTRLMMKALAAGVRPLRAKRVVERAARLVTITLRECEHWPARNSDVAEWILAADRIRDMGFDVVFVRDTRAADCDELAGFPCNRLGSIDLHTRADLYSSAFCNLFVNNGPAWLCLALDAPTLMVKPTTESLGRCYSAAYFAECGWGEGRQLPGSPAHQRVVWDDDRADVIVPAFEEFVAKVAS